MGSLKQSMLDFIKQNQPVTEKQLKDGLGISLYSCREHRKQLRDSGLIYVTSGSGAFISRADFELWLEHGGGHEKISNTAKKGIHCAPTDITSSRQVTEFLATQTEPVCAGEISRACNLGQKTTYRILAKLTDDGTVFHDGRVKGRLYLMANGDNHFPSDSSTDSERKARAFVKYNPNKNGVVQDYMQSAARARLMAVYGRVG